MRLVGEVGSSMDGTRDFPSNVYNLPGRVKILPGIHNWQVHARAQLCARKPGASPVDGDSGDDG